MNSDLRLQVKWLDAARKEALEAEEIAAEIKEVGDTVNAEEAVYIDNYNEKELNYLLDVIIETLDENISKKAVAVGLAMKNTIENSRLSRKKFHRQPQK